jgi:hypothetical protein
VLEQAGGRGGGATCRDVTTGAKRREERSGRSRSRGGGRCRFVEDEVRSDATPDRRRSRPEVCGGIAFARQLAEVARHGGVFVAIGASFGALVGEALDADPVRSGSPALRCEARKGPWEPRSGGSRVGLPAAAGLYPCPSSDWRSTQLPLSGGA